DNPPSNTYIPKSRNTESTHNNTAPRQPKKPISRPEEKTLGILINQSGFYLSTVLPKTDTATGGKQLEDRDAL
ncbi:MAG: hypothetical protein QW104_06010, partial [Nitrososphaerota archaeon]